MRIDHNIETDLLIPSHCIFKELLPLWIMDYFTTLLVLCTIILGSTQAQDFDVVKYGAVGDGATDDSKAFSSAWAAACGASGTPTLQIPEGKKFLLKPITFTGPCKSSTVNVKLLGTIIAPSDPSAWTGLDQNKWLVFQGVNGLNVDGTGTIDGQGSAWWEKCGKDGCTRPSALLFDASNNLKVNGLRHLNSQRNHISIVGSDTVTLSNLKITAPETSPNTDGIDIANCKNIQITESNIATGDDCVAIGGGSSFINITGVNCGPGHGISIGSLGKGGADETVEEVHVKGCTFTGTQNGARIKTWQGGSGHVRKVSFEDITLSASQHPIIIDQFYSALFERRIPRKSKGIFASEDLGISDVTFTGFRGSSATPVAIALNCSESVGCTGITLAHINIVSSTGGTLSSTCINAHGTSTDCNPKVDCLKA